MQAIYSQRCENGLKTRKSPDTLQDLVQASAMMNYNVTYEAICTVPETRVIADQGVHIEYPNCPEVKDNTVLEQFVLRQRFAFAQTAPEDCSLDISYETVVNSGEHLGFALSVTTNTGGFHSSTTIVPFNFDRNGQYYEVKFQDYSKIAALCKEKLRPLLEQEGAYYPEMFSRGLTPKPEHFSRVIETDEGYVFFFPEGQIAPYSAGMRSCTILKSQL